MKRWVDAPISCRCASAKSEVTVQQKSRLQRPGGQKRAVRKRRGAFKMKCCETYASYIDRVGKRTLRATERPTHATCHPLQAYMSGLCSPLDSGLRTPVGSALRTLCSAPDSARLCSPLGFTLSARLCSPLSSALRFLFGSAWLGSALLSARLSSALRSAPLSARLPSPLGFRSARAADSVKR